MQPRGMLRALGPLTTAPYAAMPNAPGFIEAASGGMLMVSMVVEGGGGGKNGKSVWNSAAWLQESSYRREHVATGVV